MADNHDSPKTLQIDEPSEGERIETKDYFFCKIGASIPLTSSNDAVFDTTTVPSKPLTVSPKLGLIFVAHSSGFCVARIKDVITAAKGIKEEGTGCSVSDLSIVDVDVGRVSVLALSDDSSYIAAAVGREIHFFSVDSLLNKDKKPIFSCSVTSNNVRDMIWIKGEEPSYVLLTDTGNLLIGALNKPLNIAMDGIDAMDRSVDGNLIAIGQKNSLRIMSLDLKEVCQILLPLDSFTGDDTESNSVKVDSLRWVREDSIVVGSLRQTDDGREEDYLLQIVVNEGGSFLRDCSKLTAVQFHDLFPAIVDDIVPFGCGPNLLMSYVENCEFAVVSNRKNTDEHIMLCSWSQGENQVSVIDIERDNWLPRIELQENGDDNLVLGVCNDKASVFENVKVTIDGEEQRELRPHCLLVCLTLEGKLVMFNVASIAGSRCSSEALPAPLDNIQTIPVVSLSSNGEAPSQSERVKQSASDAGSHGLTTSKFTPGLDGAPVAEDLTTDKNVKFSTELDENLRKESFGGDNVQKVLADFKSPTAFGQIEHFPQEIATKSPLRDTLTSNAIEMGMNASPDKPPEKYMSNAVKGLEHTGFAASRSISTPSGSSSYLGISGISDVRPFSSASSTRSTLSGTPFSLNDTARKGGSSPGNLSSHQSDTFSSSFGKVTNYSQKPTSYGGVAGTSPSIPGSKVQSREGVSTPSSMGQSIQPSHKSIAYGQLTSEQKLPKQFDNVQKMTRELDKLLECIERSGGFRDICTTAHESSLKALEEGMQSLSERTTVLQSATEERLREIEHLLDKTIQVLARKTHMEGVIRQTADEQYWDLWNRQKLNSELDQKRQTMLKQSQDLVNRMIELEKHFNVLELNIFGESSGANSDHRALHNRSDTLRHRHSLHTIQNATVSQLAAAQQLSDFLSRQMAVLSIKSPPAKHIDIKKQVFETIGLSYPDDNLSSPNIAKAYNSPSSKRSLGSLSAVTHDEFKRSHLSGRSSDLESSRRRRDSLDRSWAKFEAPKTTVKRMLVQNEQLDGIGLFSSADKKFVSHGNLEGSIAENKKLFGLQDNKGGMDIPTIKPDTTATSAFQWVGAIPVTQVQAEHSSKSGSAQGIKFPAVENRFASPSVIPSLSSSSLNAPDRKKENSNTAVNGPERQIGGDVGQSASSVADMKPSGSHWGLEKSIMQKIPAQQSLPSVNSSQISTYRNDTGFLKPDGSNSSGVSIGKHNTNFTSTVGSLGTLSTSSSSITLRSQTLPMAPVVLPSATTGKVAKDVSEEVIQVPSPPFSSASSEAAHVDSFPSKSPVRVDLNFLGSSSNSANESPTLRPQFETIANKAIGKTNLATESQVSENLALPAKDKLKSESSTQAAAPAEAPTSSVNPPNSSSPVTVASDDASNTPPEKQSTAFTMPSMSPLNTLGTAIGKNDSNTTLPQEDEMEEEAPETHPAADLSLGGLSGFAIGTAVSSTTPKSNPFGGPFSTTSPSTPASFNHTVPSGQLFRPASFSFPSPQSSQQSQSSAFGSTVAPQQPPAASGFGQPGQVGYGGQQALGSVLGSFGQSRQIGAGLPGTGFGSPSSGGYLNVSPVGGFGVASANTGGFASASAKSGGFAGIGATASGFAGIGAAASGFASAAPSGGGFTSVAFGGGFGAAATNNTGGGFSTAGSAAGGFGAFSNQGSGGFSGLGAGGTGGQPPSELFTQMRR